jgi:hemerythrin-like domain-containing protein
VAIDPNSLPRDAETLRKIVMDLAEQLDRSLAEQNKYQSLLRELLEAQRNRKSEQLSKEQLALFEAAWQARSAGGESAAGEDDDDLDGDTGGANLWHGICSGRESFTTWPRRKSTVPAAASTCG